MSDWTPESLEVLGEQITRGLNDMKNLDLPNVEIADHGVAVALAWVLRHRGDGNWSPEAMICCVLIGQEAERRGLLERFQA